MGLGSKTRVARFALVGAVAIGIGVRAHGQVCHSNILADTPRAGPGHNCKQMLRYDPDGPGPRLAELVSLGDDLPNEAASVVRFDQETDRWRPLGVGVERIVAPIAGVAFGSALNDDGPMLAVVNQSSTTSVAADVSRFYIFDGSQWTRQAGPGAYSAGSPGAFDPDGDGPLPRSLVGAWRPAADAPPRVSMLLNGAWTAVGDVERFGFDGITQLIAYDPDGDGPVRELLVAAGAFNGSVFQTLLYWDGRTWKEFGPPRVNLSVLRVLDFDGDGPEPAKLVAIGWIPVEGSTYDGHPYMCFDGARWSVESSPRWTSLGTLGRDMFRRADGSLWLATGGSSYSSISGFYEFARGQWTLRGRIASISASSRWTALTIPDGAGSDRLFFRTFRDTVTSTPYATVKEVTTFDSATSYLITPTPGQGFDDAIYSGFAAADGSVYVSGVFTSVNGKIMQRVARRSPDGEWHAMGAPRWQSGPGLAQLHDGRVLGVGTRVGQPGGVFEFDGTDWVPFLDLGYTFTASSVRGSANGILTIFNFKPTGANVSRAIVQYRRGELVGVDESTQSMGAIVLPNGDLVRSVTPDPTRPETQTGLMRWNGEVWSSMGRGDSSISNASLLPSGGLIGRRFGVPGIFRWSGDEWQPEPLEFLFPMTIDWGNARVVALGEDDFLLYATVTYGIQNGYTPRTSYFAQMVRVVHGVYTPIFDDRFVNVVSPFVPSAFVLPNGNTFVLGNVRRSYSGYTSQMRHTNFACFEITPCDFCSACIADWDGSEVVDAMDVAAFFVDYEQGNRCADVDDSTGVDGTDMALFFAAYEAGGC
jgi:hypothetical protein